MMSLFVIVLNTDKKLRCLWISIEKYEAAKEQIRVTAACWKDFTSRPVLESHHQEVLGQVAGDEDIWAPLVCKLPLQSRCWLKARNEWIMMGGKWVFI